MKKFFSILYSIIRFIFFVIVVTLIVLIITQKISKNKMSIGGIRLFTVVTESMMPEYKVGTTIIVKQTNPEKIQIGDDITYFGAEESFKEKVVTHRVIGKNSNEDGTSTFETKGIANEQADPKILDSQIYGKVLYKIKTVTYLNGIMGNLYGMYFVILIPLAILIVREFVDFKKDDDGDDEKEENNREKRRKENTNENNSRDKREQRRKEIRNKRREKRRNKQL